MTLKPCVGALRSADVRTTGDLRTFTRRNVPAGTVLLVERPVAIEHVTTIPYAQEVRDVAVAEAAPDPMMWCLLPGDGVEGKVASCKRDSQGRVYRLRHFFGRAAADANAVLAQSPFLDDTVVVTTTRDVAEGEEILLAAEEVAPEAGGGDGDSVRRVTELKTAMDDARLALDRWREVQVAAKVEESTLTLESNTGAMDALVAELDASDNVPSTLKAFCRAHAGAALAEPVLVTGAHCERAQRVLKIRGELGVGALGDILRSTLAQFESSN
jgi:hypothetical protein